MTSNDLPKRRQDDKSKPLDQPRETERSHEPLGDVSKTDLSDAETEELARDIEAERDA
ncbi:MAG: hypothetical protein KJ944_07585 [Alphaproteobacteria bacterium]|nr:hypothetical protein [Alphaproteobacteria bacterium]MBU1561173.1 hypothetical protein [Alphaproteobacteria bacterium]MBU2302442.1 hypothetical protein [Alphaproteobacteria bacterium]MBU2366590.1 hypothetical protein [Alphaproteobacteria bacterium]